MSIPFTCPYCGQQTNVADHLAGTSGTCGTCAQPISIPAGVPSKPVVAPHRGNVGLIAALIVLGLILAGSAIGLVGWMVIPAVVSTQAAGNKTVCTNNLKQIAVALQAYHDEYKCLPPAYLTDDTGKPAHSWRVLILPYLGPAESEIYKQYSFDEPWNGPNNTQLTGEMPDVYFCPQNPDKAAQRGGETNYMVIVGQETMFPDGISTTFDDATDGTANTIMVVETTARGINWMKPHDLRIDDMNMEINAGPKEPGSYHAEGGVHVVMGDGSVHFLPESTRQREFYNSTTRDGGEPPHLNAVK